MFCPKEERETEREVQKKNHEATAGFIYIRLMYECVPCANTEFMLTMFPIMGGQFIPFAAPPNMYL